MGHGEIDFARGDFLNEQGIIFVSFNYRVNILGFLNSGDRSAPGNFAIKDMIMVLNWVRNNIQAFGGNPNNVGIYGASGGAVAVSENVSTIVRDFLKIR